MDAGIRGGVALVTGASAGLGEAVALHFHSLRGTRYSIELP